MQTAVQTRLENTLAYMREKVLLPREFALKVYHGQISAKPLYDWNQNEGSLQRYAYLLGKEELESLLIMFVRENSDETKNMILKILELRMSPRLVQLIWALAQFYFSLPEMRIAASMAANYRDCREEMLKILFSQEQDFIGRVVQVIDEHRGRISEVINDYNLILDSPLANTVFQRFFRQAEEKEFLLNKKYFIKILDEDPEAALLPVVINYLEQQWLNVASRSINMKLRTRFGMPGDGTSVIWADIPEELAGRFRQLVFLNMMEDFLGPASGKFHVFSKYNQDIKEIGIYCNNEIMVIDFGCFGTVNTVEMKDHSLLVGKATLEIMLERFQKQPAEAETGPQTGIGSEALDEMMPFWARQRSDIQARDVIIEEKSSDILVLDMHGLGKLYTEELMNELLRKEEEFWPVKFKLAIARFKNN